MDMKRRFPIVLLKQDKIEGTIIQKRQTFDFICVLEGRIEMSVDKSLFKLYKTNDLRVFNPANQYVLKADGENQVLMVCIEPAFVESYISTDYIIFCDSVSEPNRNYSKIKNILMTIALQYTNNVAMHELSVYSLLFQLLDVLKKDFTLHMSRLNRAEMDHKHELRIHEIQEYVRQNYKQDISLTSLAKHMHLSNQYLSKIFNESFKLHFNQYVNSYRIMMAERELKFSDRSITDIALNNGFQNIALFNKYFRNLFKISPKEYRKQYYLNIQKEESENKSGRSIVPVIDSEDESRLISINTKKSAPFKKNLCCMINIGMAKNLLQENFQNQTSQAHRELGFKYVRLQWLVSNAMIPKLVGNNAYYFVFLENCLDFLYKEQLIPFIELSRSAERYASNGEGTWNSVLHSVDTKFLSLLEAFLQFVTLHYDSVWYEKWIFELQKPVGEGTDSFLDGFSKVQRLIRKYIPNAQVGGPGHNIALPAEKLVELLEKFKEREVRPDFISIHCFTMQYFSCENEYGRVCVYEVEEFQVLQKWITLQIGRVLNYECPLYITELNSCLIRDTYINHSCYQAAFLCRCLLSIHNDSFFIGYWGLNDTALALGDSSHLSTDGLALINRNGILMPSYFAYSLLNRLGKELVEIGEDYCVTKTDDEHYQILVYYYVSFSNYSFLSRPQRQSLRSVYSEYKDAGSLNITFSLCNLPPGIYRVRKHLIDKFHGSYVDLRIREFVNSDIDEEDFLVRTMTPAPDEMDYVKTCCVPEESTNYINVEKSLEIFCKTDPHSVCLWEISREI